MRKLPALGSCDLVAFVGTTDASRARAFYGDALGLPVASQDNYACMFKVGKTMLRVAVVERVIPAPYTVLGWVVSDMSRSIRDLGGRGITFIRFDGMEQDPLGIWRAPSGAQIAWFRDPDGNILSLTGR